MFYSFCLHAHSRLCSLWKLLYPSLSFLLNRALINQNHQTTIASNQIQIIIIIKIGIISVAVGLFFESNISTNLI